MEFYELREEENQLVLGVRSEIALAQCAGFSVTAGASLAVFWVIRNPAARGVLGLSNVPQMWLANVACLLGFASFVFFVWTLISIWRASGRNQWRFDRAADRVSRGGHQKCALSQVRRVVVVEFDDMAWEHRLMLVLASEEEWQIGAIGHTSARLRELERLAERLAVWLNVPVLRRVVRKRNRFVTLIEPDKPL